MLNPSLDPSTLRRGFDTRQRLQIPDFLDTATAEHLYLCLHTQVPWDLAYIEHGKPTKLPADRLVTLPHSAIAQIIRHVNDSAMTEFQFLYNTYMMVTAYKEGRDGHLAIHSFTEFLNSPVFLGFVSSLTGAGNLKRANAQATRYLPGHFLKRHNDLDGSKGREYAFVLYLTKDWQADFGGLLQFYDDNGTLEETFLPIFNSLCIFKVPKWHCVSYVAPYATKARYAITGWVLSTVDAPPTAQDAV